MKKNKNDIICVVYSKNVILHVFILVNDII